MYKIFYRKDTKKIVTAGFFGEKYEVPEGCFEADISEDVILENITEYKYEEGSFVHNPDIENRRKRLKAKYEKELEHMVWKEVQKNKEGNLDAEDLKEIEKRIE